MTYAEKVSKILAKKGYVGVRAEDFGGAVRLSGETDSWEAALEAGRLAVNKKRSRGVVNDIVPKGFSPEPARLPGITDKSLDGFETDVLVIGGGIVGAAIARELTRYAVKVAVVEKEYDVATAQSARNDGMIHAGIDLKPDCKKVKYNVRGNKMYDALSKELDVPIERPGQLVLYTARWQKYLFPFIKLRGARNGIPVYPVSPEGVKEYVREPGLNYGGFMCPSAGVVSPYLMTIALMENAAHNGAEVFVDTAVTGMELKGGKIVSVATNRGIIYPKVVINAAGVFSDKIAEMAGDRHFTIHPRRGVEAVLDKKAYPKAKCVVGKFVISGSSGSGHTKGGGVIVTIDRNLLLGPSARECAERENEATTREELDEVFEKQSRLAPEVKRSDIITYFAGTRAATYEEDFVVEKSEVTSNFIQAAGIQSPGVTAAPAIAEDAARWAVREVLGELRKNPSFDPYRKGIPVVREMDKEARAKLIAENPDFGEIVCRCEEISKGEIIAALHTPLKVDSVDAVKRRVRAGMGRCQGGFCQPSVVKIISEELGIPPEKVGKKGAGSEVAPYPKKGGGV